jgi:hypothetical protein
VRTELKTIPVRDPNGDQLTLYEIREGSCPLALFSRKRLVLCTGEAVRSDGRNGFIVAATGERLERA